ncbi:MAG TPA: tripartite tricarboxylate transporter substrate binding protein, partial [Planctomycetota bacterium]|nr:tripartite tricarboxylate transporter substrate binding protein [Planctomycetota bacterium]
MLKRTLGLSLVALVALAAAGPAAGQGKYPTRPIEVVVPYAPGGGTDILMRTIVAIIDENKWSPRPVTVMNRAGGSGAVGYTYLISQKGNPHTVAGATPMVV